MKVFFYGLFMDEGLLAAKGIEPTTARAGLVDAYALRIGERATLLHHPGGRAYGVLMEIASSDVSELYSEESVADYLPEVVTVELEDGTRTEATCFNLPRDKITGTNKDYAKALLDLATRQGFPDSYLDQIRQAGNSGNSARSLRIRDRLLYGVVLPIAIMVAALFAIMHADTGAAAAEFASLGIFLGTIIAAPVVLIVNLFAAFQPANRPMNCFKRGMIAPGIVVIGAIVYQTGLWDAIM